MRDKPARAANSQNRELALHLGDEHVDENAGKSDTAPAEPDKIKAGFAELAFHPTCQYHEQQNGRATIRVAVTEDGVTYVSIADFLEFIKVHNRLNAQSMASNLIMDANKKRKYELLHGAINGSKRRTPMIRMADQFPKYVCSIGKLKALNSTLPERDAATLWNNFCSSSLPEWFEEELKKSTRVDGVLAEWTDEQWTHRTMQVNNGAATVKRSQPTRKRKILRQEVTCRNKWVYRELSKVLVTLPLNMNPGDTFSLRVPGVHALVDVEFPEGGVPGKTIELKLVDPIMQKVLASEVEPGSRCMPCYDELDEERMLTDISAQQRPKDRVPSLLEIAAMRAEMQCQPGLQHADVSAGKESVAIPVVNTVDDEVFDLNTFRYVSTPEYPEKIQALIDAAPPVPCDCTGTCGGVGADLCGCVDRYGDVYDLVVKVELKALPPNQCSVPASAVSTSQEGATPAGRRRPGAGVPRRVRARKVGNSEWTTYPSVNQAHKGTGVDYSDVFKCCKTLLPESGGYVFEYDTSSAHETEQSSSLQKGRAMSQQAISPTSLSSDKKLRPCSCKACGAQKSAPNEKCRRCNPDSLTTQTLGNPAKPSSGTGRFDCGALLAKAVADALGGLDVSSIHSDEDNHKTGGGLDGVASVQYKTQVDNETMSGVASLFGTSVGAVLDSSKHWYPDLSANSRMFPGTYVRLPAQIGRLAAGCFGLMNIAGTSLGPQEVSRRLANLQAADALWEAIEVKVTRYGAYHKGRLGPAISFSVIHECTNACSCQKLQQGHSGTTEGCGNRHLQRGIRPDVLLEVFRAGTDKGWGLRSRTFIPAGTFVCEYVGEIMTDTQANERGRLKGPEYLFDLDVAVQRRHDEQRQKKNGQQQKDNGDQRDDDVDEEEDTQEFVRLLSSSCTLWMHGCWMHGMSLVWLPRAGDRRQACRRRCTVHQPLLRSQSGGSERACWAF
jgi:euchromatic histone-lysine N-methyltransferase